MWWLKPAILSASLFVFVWLLVFGHQGLQEMEKLLAIRTKLNEEKTFYLKQKATLEKEQEQLNLPDYLEHLIREELGYVRSGEVVVKFRKAN